MTKTEFEKLALKLSKKKTLGELKREQDIISAESRSLYNWNTKKYTGTPGQFWKLSLMYDLRTAAIDRQCFPKETPIDYYQPGYSNVVF